MQKFRLLLVLFSLLSFGAYAQRTTAIEGKLVKVIPSLKNLPPVNKSALISVFDENGKRIWPAGIVKPNMQLPVEQVPVGYTDPVIQQSNSNPLRGSSTSNIILAGIEGLATGVQPMDPSICVGSNHVIELVNDAPTTLMKIWDKNGNVAVNDVTLQALSGFPGYGDPIALYDQYADRYIITEFIIRNYNGSTENGMTVMVSQTGDPTQGWFLYKWTIPEAYTLDYPKWSVSTESIFLHTNNFSQSTGGYVNSYMAAMNKADMYSGAASFRSLRINQTAGYGYSTCPVQLQGVYNEAGTFAVSDASSGSTNTLLYYLANWTNNTLTQNTLATVTLPAYTRTVCSAARGACVQQPNAGASVETLTNRIMNQPIGRNFGTHQGIVYSFTVNAGSSKSGIRWVELRNNGSGWALHQNATWSPNTHHQFMPSMSYDADGNIGLAYSSGSTTRFLGIYYTSRTSCDPLGQMTLPETELKAGNAVSSGSRWGDYNHLIADPDGQSLWMVSMYGRSGALGGKGSYISRFSLDDCSGGPVCNAPASLTANPVDETFATVNWPAVTEAVSYDLDYKAASASNWTNVTTGTISTTVTILNLTPNTVYDVRVRANCASTSSSYTAAQFTTTGTVVTCPDAFEPNNTTGTATAISTGVNQQAQIASASDNDYYSFSNTRDLKKIRVSLTNLPANYDMSLIRPNGNIQATSANTGTANELIIHNPNSNNQVGTYRVRVYGFNGAFNSNTCYTLRVDLSASNFTSLPGETTGLLTVRSGFRVYPNPASTVLNLSFDALRPGTAMIQIRNNYGQTLSRKTVQVNNGINGTQVDVSSLANGVYTISVQTEEGLHQQKFVVKK